MFSQWLQKRGHKTPDNIRKEFWHQEGWGARQIFPKDPKLEKLDLHAIIEFVKSAKLRNYYHIPKCHLTNLNPPSHYLNGWPWAYWGRLSEPSIFNSILCWNIRRRPREKFVLRSSFPSIKGRTLDKLLSRSSFEKSTTERRWTILFRKTNYNIWQTDVANALYWECRHYVKRIDLDLLAELLLYYVKRTSTFSALKRMLFQNNSKSNSKK